MGLFMAEILQPAEEGEQPAPAGVELRPEWEMDNFSCSHLAPQTCTLVRGALVLLAPARPAIQSLCFFRFFRLALPR